MNKVAIFTMDVEAFYHAKCLEGSSYKGNLIMEDGIDNYLNLLDRYNIKADLFLVSSLNENIKDIIKKAISKGHQINIHGYSHISPLLISDEVFLNEINQSINSIKEIFNVTPCGYRAPCFYIDNYKLEIVKKAGLRFDSSYVDSRFLYYENKLNINQFEKIDNNIYLDNDFYEFALPVFKNIPIGGGGYSRLVPFNRYFSFLKRYLKNNNYFVFYVHPFELSSVKIPKLKNINMFDRLYLKVGRDKYIKRIEKIINLLIKEGFSFQTFEDQIKK